MTKRHSSNSVAAKARKRLHSPPPDYFSEPDYSQPVRRVSYENAISGEKHEFVFYIAPQRIDQFRIVLDGKVWKERMGWSHFCAALRKAAGRFSRMQ